METAQIEMDRDAAKRALAEYRQHRERASNQDLAIMRAYRAIAKGKVVIDPFQSIRQAGLDEDGRPLLAFARADWKHCDCAIWRSGECEFRRAVRRPGWGWSNGGGISYTVKIPNISNQTPNGRAMVPMVPLNLRPKASNLSSYHILWEADWKDAPIDPLLLRKLTGNLYVVVAAWDLTPVERAAMRGSV